MTRTLEDIAQDVRKGIEVLRKEGRLDLILQSVGGNTVEQLRVEMAKSKLSQLLITKDYRFLLPAYNKEVEMSPLHKAVYLLFLNHPEGIEFKELINYRQELRALYRKTANIMDVDKIEDSVDRLVNPLDNAINEKCSRIKKAFTDITDEYTAQYYIISSRMEQPISSTGKIWYKRLKVIKLPRELVCYEDG
jgi:hypothetical protein